MIMEEIIIFSVLKLVQEGERQSEGGIWVQQH